jgi:hypothetical protein
MADPSEIYLEPECCAYSTERRCWAQHDIFECDHHAPSTKYVLAGESEAEIARLRAALERIAEYPLESFWQAVNVARKALEEKTHG